MGDYFAAYDPAKAAALLDEMGLKKGADGMRLRPDGQPLKSSSLTLSALSPLSELDRRVLAQESASPRSSTRRRARTFAQSLKAGDIQASVWFADVVSEKDMYARPIWFRPPYGLDTNPVGGGLAWREWWLSKGQKGPEPPEEFRKQMELVDAWQATRSVRRLLQARHARLCSRHVKQMLHIGTVGEVPYVYTRNEQAQEFPEREDAVHRPLHGRTAAQWYPRRTESNRRADAHGAAPSSVP